MIGKAHAREKGGELLRLCSGGVAPPKAHLVEVAAPVVATQAIVMRQAEEGGVRAPHHGVVGVLDGAAGRLRACRPIRRALFHQVDVAEARYCLIRHQRQALALHDGGAQPGVHGVAPADLLAEILPRCGVLQPVVDPPGPLVDELRRLDQFVDQRGALARAGVGQESPNRLGRRNAPREVECQPPQKLLVRGQPRRGNAHGGQFAKHLSIDNVDVRERSRGPGWDGAPYVLGPLEHGNSSLDGAPRLKRR